MRIISRKMGQIELQIDFLEREKNAEDRYIKSAIENLGNFSKTALFIKKITDLKRMYRCGQWI